MKTIYSYFMPLLLLVAVVCALPSCKDHNGASQPAQIKQLVGTWRIYYFTGDIRVPQASWVRFDADANAERFFYDTATKRYIHSTGKCKLENNWLTLEFEKEFIYEHANGMMRGMAQFMEPQPEWEAFQFLISSHTKKEIKVLTSGHTLYFRKEALDPNLWPAECCEAEQQPTRPLLTGQWDLRSYYKLDGNNFETWFFDNPEAQGMALTDNGSFQNMQFFANDLAIREKNAGRLAQDEYITIYVKDCAWMLINGMLDFVCTQYEKVKYDDRGAEISREVYTPAVPIQIYYNIHFFTGNWLTLYDSEEDLYFSFRRGTASPAAAPAAVSAARKAHKME